MQAALSPAYDLVSTIQYMPDDRLALNFGRSKRWEDMGMDTFRRLARKIDFDEAQIVGWTLQAVAATQQAWSASSHEFGYDLVARERIEQHMRRVPLFSTP